MTRSARTTPVAATLCIAMLLPALGGCDADKPSEPVVPKPVAIAPAPPVAKPAPAPAPIVLPAQSGAKRAADAGLAARVKAALDAEPQIHGFAIDVTADDGKVALFGTVQTKARRDKADQIASKIPGVKSVENNLAIVAGS